MLILKQQINPITNKPFRFKNGRLSIPIGDFIGKDLSILNNLTPFLKNGIKYFVSKATNRNAVVYIKSR